jgi:molybdate transport system ATP-binding protein
MPGLPHTAIYTDNQSRKDWLSRDLLRGRAPESLSFFKGLRGELFSNSRIEGFLEEEARHAFSGLRTEKGRKLSTYSSGERKKALLEFLFEKRPELLILDHVFDNLDPGNRRELREALLRWSGHTVLLQFLSRPEDLLPCIRNSAFLSGSQLLGFPNYRPSETVAEAGAFAGHLPPPPAQMEPLSDSLVEFRQVDLRYGSSRILHKIDWTIRKGEFWELRGPNGSGKTSLITLIIGDNPKAYGQELYLFGRRKGSGESVWEIKEKIGYFTPSLTDRFRGTHKTEDMLISGLLDSVGLYVQPTEQQRLLARKWLGVLGLTSKRDILFRKLTEGQQRLVMCARAMIKHPPLLILDEPTAGLDRASAALLVSLVRKMAQESETAIVFVSHRKEPGLDAPRVLELKPGPEGSTGIVHRHGHA